LAAPESGDGEYKNYFNEIVEFQIDYANKIIDNDRDNVVIIVNKDVLSYYEGRLPDDVLLIDNVYDIWMRDFTLVNPFHPVRFKYTWASTVNRKESQSIQESFLKLSENYNLRYDISNYLIDGGNIVDSFNSEVVHLLFILLLNLV
jgi:agmatine/peptidylarginine deiminase